MPRAKQDVHGGAGKLRIIGGQWRGRVLKVLDQEGLRPTPDRVRETLFNWLQADVPNARCLDLFAGSGALGFEAASRGAEQVLMLELQTGAFQLLQDNARQLKSTHIKCLQQDAIQWINQCDAKYDVVFLDPPYDSDLLSKSIDLLEQNQCLADEAKIYIELPSDRELPELPTNWQLIRGKKAGQVGYHLAIRQTRD